MTKFIPKFSRRYKIILIAIVLIWGVWAFGLGTLTGFLFSKAGLNEFPKLSSHDKLLVLAPHIDDEIISSAGVIQQLLSLKGKVKIVYLTNGDNNLLSVFKEDKSLKIDPNDFIKLGEQRMMEAKKATQNLGLTAAELIFLGYPDQGLLPMINNFYNETTTYTAQGSKLNYNPYQGTYRQEQLYTGSNVVSDLKEIITNFQPTIIFVSHPKDHHPDHRALFLFLQKIINETKTNARIYTYLVHYPYPPKKLFSKNSWFSFDLTEEQGKNKLTAISQNASQLGIPHLYELLQSFVKRNEIFEEIEY